MAFVTGYPVVHLGDCVVHRKQFVAVDDLAQYKRIRVQLHGKGVLLRDLVFGADLKTKDQQLVQSGDLIVAEIDAKLGGIGIVSRNLTGAIVSSHYFLYEIDERVLLRDYLGYYIRAGRLEEQVHATGSTNYAAIRPQHVLNFTTPLPPLTEQRRIVARIEELAGKIAEIRVLGNAMHKDLQAMLMSAYSDIVRTARRMPLGEVAPLLRRPIVVDESQTYHELGVRSFGKGTFHKPAISGIDLGSKRVFLIEPGDLMFSNVFAWEGAVAVARPEDRGRIGSHRFITCVPMAAVATAPFLLFHFLTSEGLGHLGEASPGGAGRNRTLGLEALAKIPVPVPDLGKQHWFNELSGMAGAIRQVQADADGTLDALVPSILNKAFSGQL